ncbi:MAG: sulfatase [Planctomycetota bacterium]|jgi:arylsulfatase A-like enzyme
MGGSLARALLAVACALLASCPGKPASSGATPTHLLLITVDTLRADHLGVYGHPDGISPSIDALGARGMVFHGAHAPASWTLASLASVMTSTPSSVHGCWNFKSSLSDGAVTLAEVLGEHGYRTAAVASHVFLGPKYGLHQGFDDYDVELVQPGLVKSHEAISSPQVSEKGIAALQGWAADPETPQFLWLHYFDPHSEYQAHPAFVGRFGRDRDQDLYRGEIAFTDRAIGRVLNELERVGLTERTVVAFTSDHGEEWGEHGGQGHGTTLHAEQVRVPLILAGPGFGVGSSDEPISTLDLAPSLLDVLDVPAPPTFLGESWPTRRANDGPTPQVPVVEELRLRPGREADGLRVQDWHLIRPRNDKPARLYRLDLDPLEQDNLIEAEPERAAEMSARLTDLLAGYAQFAQEAKALTHTDEELQRLSDLGYADGPEDR